MLIVNGVKYKPWTPTNEEKEFHPLIKANSKEIFGKDTIYFDVKTTLKSTSGIGSIPDAYVIKLTEPYEWYVIENELATHSIYGHVVNQLTKFINGLDNKDTRTQILEMLYEVINKDNSLRTLVSTKTGYVDIHHFLSKLFLATNPRIVVIIDKVTLDLEEACQALRHTPEIIEFKSFVTEDGSRSYAHLFEPLNSKVNTTIEEAHDNESIEDFIERRKPQRDNEEAFRKLVQETERLSNQISKKIKVTTVSFKTKRPFVTIELRKTQIILHLTLPNKPKEKDVEYLRKVYDNKWHCHLIVRNLSEAELAMEICKKAYEESLH
jgi:predicted transport protein